MRDKKKTEQKEDECQNMATAAVDRQGATAEVCLNQAEIAEMLLATG